MPIDSVTLSDAYDPGERAPAKPILGGLINEYTAALMKHGTTSHQLKTYFEQDRVESGQAQRAPDRVPAGAVRGC